MFVFLFLFLSSWLQSGDFVRGERRGGGRGANTAAPLQFFYLDMRCVVLPIGDGTKKIFINSLMQLGPDHALTPKS